MRQARAVTIAADLGTEDYLTALVGSVTKPG